MISKQLFLRIQCVDSGHGTNIAQLYLSIRPGIMQLLCKIFHKMLIVILTSCKEVFSVSYYKNVPAHYSTSTLLNEPLSIKIAISSEFHPQLFRCFSSMCLGAATIYP